MGKAGLMWVGEKFYKTPEVFVAEGVTMGFSKRIKAVPRGFKVGETYVLLAHPKAIDRIVHDGSMEANTSLSLELRQTGGA